MNKNYLYLCLPIVLTGCLASWITGDDGYDPYDFPDIRTVPERKEATEPRHCHEGNEQTSRVAESKKLEQDRESLKARNEALREKAFPNSSTKSQ